MELPSIGNLFEGVLVREDGNWKIKRTDDTDVNLDFVLSNYLDEDIRFTVVRIEDLEKLAKLLEQE